LPGRLDLREIAENGSDKPAANRLQTARALLALAETDIDSLTNEEYEIRKAELEAVSNDLTRQVFDYWTQNRELSVEIDIDKVTVRRADGQQAVARYMDVRVKDARHGFTNNFGQRSSGFQWFFSFLAAFSEFERGKSGIVVLLDEPALGLHARAQADFLRFIEERLAPVAQVLYTTHSPFMVPTGHLERVRIVEDQGSDRGTVVTQDVFSSDRDTLFPLQAALGYDIAQSLFIGPDNLVVEGSSDFTYLTIISDYLASAGQTPLNERWRILYAGSASNVPAFVALIGPRLEVTVLVDAGTQGMQRLNDMAKNGLLRDKRLITVAQVTGTANADIEDLFSVSDYLAIYNAALGQSVTEQQLAPGDRIVRRLAATVGDFNHGIPADYFLRHRDTILPSLSPVTLDRFEKLFQIINATLS
jgi:predicted ATP-dependent endonuclease of OLD family